MHLSDGLLDPKTTLVATGVAATGVALALRQVRHSISPRQMPMLGLAGAFIFAAQMLNFPVLAGTSGHLVGGVLVAILLGPAAAVLVMTCVLVVQCLMFSDGGLLALGANVFNMALVNVGAGWLAYRLLRRVLRMEERRATVLAAAFAGWFGVVAAAVSCAGQLAWSGLVEWRVVFPAMAGVHMLIGLGEGVITALVVLTVTATRPELMAGDKAPSPAARRRLLACGVLIALGLAIFVAPHACRWPDGLEAVAAKFGVEPRKTTPILNAPLPDYGVPGIQSATAATALAGAVGTSIAFLAAYALARVLVPGRRPLPPDARP